MKPATLFRSPWLYALLALVVTQLACGQTALPEPSATPSQTATQQPAAPTSSPTAVQSLDATAGFELLRRATQNMFNSYPRILNASVQDASGSPATLVLLEDGEPGLSHLRVSQGEITLMEMILITPTIYVQMAGTPWQALDAGQNGLLLQAFTANLETQSLDGEDGKLTRFNPLGNEDLNGILTAVYEFSFTQADGGVATGKAWIGVQDERLYQLSLQTPDGKLVSETLQYGQMPEILPPAESASPD